MLNKTDSDLANERLSIKEKIGYIYMDLLYKRDYILYLMGLWRGAAPHVLPHYLKRKLLQNIAKQYNAKVFVETGTYYGDMIYALCRHFDELYSIELSDKLFKKAKRRLATKNNVRLYRGNSGLELQKVLGLLDRRAIFWLDAHYSGSDTASGNENTPIIDELRVILEHPVKDHVILIDDARDFNGHSGYPTIEQMRKIINSYSRHIMSVRDDIIFLLPKEVLATT